MQERYISLLDQLKILYKLPQKVSNSKTRVNWKLTLIKKLNYTKHGLKCKFTLLVELEHTSTQIQTPVNFFSTRCLLYLVVCLMKTSIAFLHNQ